MRRNLYFRWLVAATCLVASLFSSTSVHASHAVGSDLTYVALGNNTYRFTFTFYYDCSSTNPQPTTYTANVAGCGNTAATFSLAQLGPPVEITPLCPTGTSTCNGGTVQGVRKYTYSGVYTFPSACANWIVSTSQCCRNTVNTIANSSSFDIYAEALVNNNVVNSSPDFTVDPVPYVCINQSFTYNHGVVDPEGDLITYALVPPLSAANTNINYSAPYTAQVPLTVQTPPGVVFNTTTGQMTFTPITVGQTTIVSVLVTETRNGVLISTVRRDMQIIVLNCGANQTPQVGAITNVTGATFTPQNNSGTFNICPGQTMSFSVAGTDGNGAQILTFLSNAATAFPGSTVNITNGAGNTRIYNFTWTPTASDVGTRTLAIRIEDNNCPILGFAIEGYTIVVQGVNGAANKGALCIGSPTVINLTSQAQTVPGGQYQWTANPPVPGQPVLPNNQNITVTISQQTTFTVRYQDGNCNATDTVLIQAYGPVSASPAVVSNYCPTDPALQLGASYNNPAPVPPAACTLGNVAQCTGIQTNRSIGTATGNTGTTSTGGGVGSPYQGYWHDGRFQMLLTAAELTAAGVQPGLITRLQFNVTSKFSTAAYNSFTIKMGCTSLTALSAGTGFLGGLSQVFDPASVTTTVGLNQYAFNTPYRWDGISSLVIEVCYDNTGFTGYDHVSTTVTSGTTVLYRRQDAASGCTLTGPTATTTRPDIILRNCPIVVPPAGVTYSWNIVNAANGAVSNANISNPTATATAGLANGTVVRYIVTASDGRCTSKDTVVVNINCAPTPCDVTAGIASVVSTELNCSNPTRQLNATGPSVGDGALSYSWGNSLGTTAGIVGSTTAGIITVNAPGTYVVTVTNTKSGGVTCTSTASIVVTQDIAPPATTLTSNISVITCTNPSATLTALPNTPTAQYTFTWTATAPIAFSGSINTTNAAGTYTVNITNVNNGCSATATVAVTKQAGLPVANIAFPSPNLTCTLTTVTLDASGSTPNTVTYLWNDASFPPSPVDVAPTRDVVAAGVYTVTVTDPLNGCTSSSSRLVTMNTTAPVITLTANRTIITCTNPTATLTATLIANHIYAFPPSVASSTNNTAVVNVGGIYIVTVTNPANGCTATASITVNEDFTPPLAIISPSTAVDLTLTCTNTPIVLDATGSAPASGVTFGWSGGTTGGTKSVIAPGTYTVTATITANGCTNTAQVVVSQDVTPAAPVITAPVSELTCSVLSLTLTATAGGTAYVWSGGTAGATTNVRTVTAAGTYTVTMTSASTGCTGTSSFTVTSNTTQPVLAITAPQTLTCAVLNTSVTASGGVTYAWSGGSTPATATNTFSAPGAYTVTVTSGTNGCTNTRSVTVIQTLTQPTTSIAGAAAPQLTCTTLTTTLTASGANTYLWSNSLTTPAISAGAIGTYTVIGTLASTGCTLSATFIVTENKTLPTPNITADFQTITCAHPTATLTASGVGVNTVIWDNGTTNLTRAVIAAGTYTVTATTTANGCTQTASIVVALDQAVPLVAINAPNVLTCTQLSSSLVATGADTYVWDDNSTLNPRAVALIGTYTVTGTSTANGCSATASVTVAQNVTIPTVTIAAAPDTVLTCQVLSLNLTPSGANTYAWDLTQVASQVGNVATIVNAGTYTVTATNTANGCTATATQIILQNRTPPPIAITLVNNNSNITCAVTDVTIIASGADDYLWSNNAVTGTITVVAPQLNAIGSNTYTVVGTSSSNSCSTTREVVVTYDNRLPTPTMDADTNRLTCGIITANIYALGLGNDAFAWSGTFVSANGNTILVNQPGVYTVTVTSAVNGCTDTGSYTIIQDITNPTVSIDPAPQITCQAAVVTLTAQGADTYAWTGPNVVTQINNTANVQAIGTYQVTGTNAVNGCTATAQVVVTDDLMQPIPTIQTSNILDCQQVSATLTASGASDYVWSSNAQSAATPNVTVTTGGIYTVTATLSSNGCSSITTFVLQQDTIRPVVAVVTDFATITCLNPIATLSATPNTANYTFGWTPVLNSINPTASATAGAVYAVTVTNTANNCQNTASITIAQDNNPPTPTIIPSNPQLNCVVQNLDLTVTGNSGDTYLWEDGVTTTNPRSVSAVQIYTVTVTSGTNGCMAATSFNVTQDLTVPIITINAPATITCLNASVVLTASALPNTIPSSSFQWSNADNGFSTTNPITALDTDTYSVEVTNPLNGCSAFATVVVPRDTVSPPVTINPPSILTCATTTVQLSAQGGDNYIWSAPATTNATGLGFTNQAGVYTVTASFNGNGCTASRSVAVGSDLSTPIVSIAADIPELTCTALTANLTATGADNYVWTGVDTSNGNMATVTQPNTYTVLATQNSNGCTSQTTIFVPQNIVPPTVVANTNQTTLTCIIISADLTATGSGDTYVWSPSNSSAAPYNITVPATYTVTSTNANNGCTATASVTVGSDIAPPAPLVITAPNVLTCNNPTTTVTASGGDTYIWSPVLQQSGAIAVIDAPGTHTVTVTKTSNGCTATATVVVAADLAVPTVSVAQPNIITCALPNVVLSAATGLNAYLWVDATNNTIGSNATVPVSSAGVYTVVGTGANGCTSSATINVLADQVLPTPTLAAATNTLTCTTTSTALQASGGDVYAWANATNVNGPNATAQNAGTYTVTVTTLSNGCSAETSVVITRDITTQSPVITANFPILNCINSTINLTVSGAGPFTWSNNVAVPGQQIVTINAPGIYVVTATTPSNGCTAVTTYTVVQDLAPPMPSIQMAGTILNCNTTTLVLTASVPAGSPAVTYLWSDNLSTNINTLSVTQPNTYTVTVTQSSNGCSALAQQLVLQDIGQPITTISNTNVLTCTNPTTTLTANGGDTFVWSNNLGTTPSVTVSTVGTYTVTSTNAANFCTNTAQVVVTEDKITPVPNLLASSATITCAVPSITISANGGDSYVWSTTETTPTITVTAGDTYTVMATNAANGCTANTSILILQNITAPPLVLTTNNFTITCANRRAILTATGADVYAWTGVSSSNGGTANAIVQGTYTVTGTDTGNGCTASASISITEDLVNPTAAIEPAATLTCAVQSVVLTATGGGNYTWSNNANSTNGANATVSTQGNYTVTVTTPSNGCTATAVTTVGRNVVPPAPVISVDGQLTCVNPIRTLTATSGNSFPNNYTWSTNVNSVTDSTATVLSAGIYTVVITRASNGCTASSIIAVTQDISTPAASMTTDVATLTCTNPSGVLTANGGDSYAWSINAVAPNNNTALASASGIYTVTATQAANGCTASATVSINLDIAVPVLAANVTNVGCNGALSGAIDLLVSNSVATLYNWNNGPSTEDLSALAIGTYTCTVTGGNGCTASIAVIVEQNSPVSATFDVYEVTCNGGSDGRILTIPTGGTAPYSYNWNNGGTVGDALNLGANVYTVTITDGLGCIGTASTIVTQPTAILPIATQVSPVLCSGQANGSAIVNITGGTQPYTVRWDSQEDNLTAIRLGSGLHTVTITDAKQCTRTATVTITQPDVVAASIASSTIAKCFNTATGTMTAAVTGGTTPYTFSWSDGFVSGGATSTNLALIQGTYYITVTDLNGCSATTSGTVTQPTQIFTGVTAQTPATCALSADAHATGVASGGTPAQPGSVYAYRWDSGETSNPAVQLNRGTHTVTATDGNGCTSSAQFYVEGPDAISLNAQNIQNITCFGLSNGSISIQMVGGTPSYLYTWSNGQTTPIVTGLTAGSHTVSVTDANGCSFTPISFNVTEPAVLAVTAMTPQDPSCNAGSTGSIRVTAAGGSVPYTYNWQNGGFGQPLINLSAGDYVVTVTDARQCTATAQATIGEPTPVIATTTQVDVVCFGDKTGRIQVDNAQGGTAPYVFSLDGISFTAANYFVNIPAGTYTAYVQDALGCETTLPVQIGSEPQIQFSAGEDVSINLGENIQLQASTASITYTLAWSPTATLSDATVINPVATPTETTRYEVTLTDALGCTVKDNVLVTVLTDRRVYVPTAFSPNGDGTNDFFTVYAGTDVARIKLFQVFDRWGEQLFQARDFQANDSRYAWDGHLNGSVLNTAVFVYYIQIEFKDGKVEEFKGDVTLMK